MWSTLAELSQRRLDLGEGGAARLQEQVAAEVHHAEPHPVFLDHAHAASRLPAQVVERPHDPLLGVEVGVDLAPVVGVVAERDRVDAVAKQLLSDLRRDAKPTRHVLAVDHHERRGMPLAQDRQALEQRVTPDAAHEIAHEQDARVAAHQLPAPPRAQPYSAHRWRVDDSCDEIRAHARGGAMSEQTGSPAEAQPSRRPSRGSSPHPRSTGVSMDATRRAPRPSGAARRSRPARDRAALGAARAAADLVARAVGARAGRGQGAVGICRRRG